MTFREVHLIVLKDGKLWHRKIDGDHQFGDLGAAGGKLNERFIQVSYTTIGDYLHVCAITRKGYLWHMRGDFAHGGMVWLGRSRCGMWWAK